MRFMKDARETLQNALAERVSVNHRYSSEGTIDGNSHEIMGWEVRSI